LVQPYDPPFATHPLAWQELADWIVGEAVARNEQEKKEAGPFRTPNPEASLPKKNAGTLNLTTNLGL
jgi:hypothetical protein